MLAPSYGDLVLWHTYCQFQKTAALANVGNQRAAEIF